MKEKEIDPWLVRKIRLLSFLLILSGGLNIGLFFTFFYSVARHKSKPITKEFLPIQENTTAKITHFSNANELKKMMSLSYSQLVSLLKNKTIVEEGYSVRDLALGCLVTFHHFALDKALLKQPIQKRLAKFTHEDKVHQVWLFPSLSDYHFDGIMHFALTEKWPLTSRGLFALLKSAGKNAKTSLEQACMVSKEYHLLQTLFSLSGGNISSNELLELMKNVSFELIDNFCYEQVQVQDFSPVRRRNFLFICLEERSELAAKILLKTDMLYVLKKCNDAQVLTLLELLNQQTEDTEQFCVELLKSVRSDEVWQTAASMLYSFHHESMPKPYNHEKTLQRFVHTSSLKDKWSEQEKQIELKEVMVSVVKTPPDTKVHVVKNGDSLWKIARRYKVEMEELIRINHLKNEVIYPGTQLKLP